MVEALAAGCGKICVACADLFDAPLIATISPVIAVITAAIADSAPGTVSHQDFLLSMTGGFGFSGSNAVGSNLCDSTKAISSDST